MMIEVRWFLTLWFACYVHFLYGMHIISWPLWCWCNDDTLSDSTGFYWEKEQWGGGENSLMNRERRKWGGGTNTKCHGHILPSLLPTLSQLPVTLLILDRRTVRSVNAVIRLHHASSLLYGCVLPATARSASHYKEVRT